MQYNFKVQYSENSMLSNWSTNAMNETTKFCNLSQRSCHSHHTALRFISAFVFYNRNKCVPAPYGDGTLFLLAISQDIAVEPDDWEISCIGLVRCRDRTELFIIRHWQVR